ncbi:MAG: iron ABC transporter permease [Litoreibacter sp.]|nr:iron ABC transporter permease [Litoreibacter sp.]
MTDKISQVSPPRSGFRLDPWSVGALALACLVLAPIMAVVWIALNPSDNIWPHLMVTTLPRYLENTAILTLSTGLLAAVTGTVTAWLTAMYRFPLSGFFNWALLLPLSVPAYVGAYAIVDLLEYAGPVQTGLRAAFGWSSAQDYWFFEVRSRGMATIVLAAALFPYVYLLARAAFREQAGETLEVARALGSGPVARFLRIGLPLARPAIAAGTAIVMMETLSDFGVVEYFAVQTLTTGIFSVWLESYNAGGAAQIASLVLIFVLLLAGLEKAGRARMRFFRLSRQSRPILRTELGTGAGIAAMLVCLVPFLVGFVLPAGVIGLHALERPQAWADPELLRALRTTIWVAGLAALLTVTAALFMVYGVRLSGHALPRKLLPVTTIGYAAPGAVLGIGILIPLSFLDHGLADLVLAVTGYDPGLLLTGSAFAVILAYMVRFFAIGQGAVDAAMDRISPSMPMAARSLGRSASGTLRAVYLPLIRGSMGTALLLVFVDCLKELPATLLLRPFNFSTLATRVYDQASLENLTDASPAAMMVMAVALFAVLLLARTNR